MLQSKKIKKYFNRLIFSMSKILHKNKYLNKKAVTLVELIVVTTIIAVLPIVWFYIYTSNLVDSRDAYRITQLHSVYDFLKYYKNDKELPLPDDYIEVRVDWNVIAYQWYIWENALTTVKYKWDISKTKDPKDKIPYTYYLTKDRKYFQLMAYLEKDSNKVVKLSNDLYASSDIYVDRFPFMVWNKLWIITEKTTNIPVQEIQSIAAIWYIDFTGGLVWNYDLNIDNKYLYTSANNVDLWSKIVENANIQNTTIIWLAWPEVCWSEILDINWVDTSLSYDSAYNWWRSATPWVCTWDCKNWYGWFFNRCIPSIITILWNIFWENASNWIMDWQGSLPWDVWNDELRLSSTSTNVWLAWKVFFQNIWWVTFDSIWSDQSSFYATSDSNIYWIHWYAWSKNAWWIKLDWYGSVNTLDDKNSDVYYNFSEHKFHWFWWSQNIWWIDMSNLTLTIP